VPKQPAFNREIFHHEIKTIAKDLAYDDKYSLNTQSGKCTQGRIRETFTEFLIKELNGMDSGTWLISVPPSSTTEPGERT
jgi:hypothetical protein